MFANIKNHYNQVYFDQTLHMYAYSVGDPWVMYTIVEILYCFEHMQLQRMITL